MHKYQLECFDCKKVIVPVELPDGLTDDQLNQVKNGDSEIQLTVEQALQDKGLGLTDAQIKEIKADGSYIFNVAEVFDSCSACGTDQD